LACTTAGGTVHGSSFDERGRERLLAQVEEVKDALERLQDALEPT
jgi:hypothetical protein